MIGRRLLIHGRVQGVFYRNWAVSAACGLGISGWVRNRSDGTVEIEAHGAPEAVEALIARCRKGPMAASVDRVEVSEASGPAPEGFSKRATL